MTASVRRWTRSVTPWTSPLDSATLTRVLDRFRTWQTYGGGSVCVLV
ncbi:hypothetical protein [Streptomyces sp. NPDC004629]